MGQARVGRNKLSPRAFLDRPVEVIQCMPQFGSDIGASRPLAKPIHQVALRVFDHVAAQCDAMTREDRCNFGLASCEIIECGAIGVFGDALAHRVAEGIGEEHFDIVGARLEHHQIGMLILRLVLVEAHLHA